MSRETAGSSLALHKRTWLIVSHVTFWIRIMGLLPEVSGVGLKMGSLLIAQRGANYLRHV
ncbi:hypothetical protein [Aliiglaciecola lipolytica]|uniref:hypothetical protein n=1 Tax=Aliiglaciecola lipolytica TaxID=477689 RepID=UPI00129D0DFB|nr:hypothetical protein [Aliiglaciecola lipolytica]